MALLAWNPEKPLFLGEEEERGVWGFPDPWASDPTASLPTLMLHQGEEDPSLLTIVDYLHPRGLAILRWADDDEDGRYEELTAQYELPLWHASLDRLLKHPLDLSAIQTPDDLRPFRDAFDFERRLDGPVRLQTQQAISVPTLRFHAGRAPTPEEIETLPAPHPFEGWRRQRPGRSLLLPETGTPDPPVHGALPAEVVVDATTWRRSGGCGWLANVVAPDGASPARRALARLFVGDDDGDGVADFASLTLVEREAAVAWRGGDARREPDPADRFSSRLHRWGASTPNAGDASAERAQSGEALDVPGFTLAADRPPSAAEVTALPLPEPLAWGTW